MVRKYVNAIAQKRFIIRVLILFSFWLFSSSALPKSFAETVIHGTIWDSVFYIFYTLTLLLFFAVIVQDINKPWSSNRPRVLKSVLLLVSIETAIEIICACIYHCHSYPLVCAFTGVLRGGVFFLALIKTNHIPVSKKKICITLTLDFVLMAVAVFISAKIQRNIWYYSDKYVQGSETLASIVSHEEVLLSILNWAAISLSYCLTIPPLQLERNVESPLSRRRLWAGTAAATAICGMLCCIWGTMFKTASISYFENNRTEAYPNIVDFPERWTQHDYFVNYREFTIYRNGEEQKLNLWLKMSSYDVYAVLKDNNKLVSYSPKYAVAIDPNSLACPAVEELVSTNDQHTRVTSLKAVYDIFGEVNVIIEQDGEYIVFSLEDVKTAEENEWMTDLGRTMLDAGKISWFEYFADYFLKYDQEFIQPYINRLSEGNFTDYELELLSAQEINPEFISALAAQY